MLAQSVLLEVLSIRLRDEVGESSLLGWRIKELLDSGVYLMMKLGGDRKSEGQIVFVCLFVSLSTIYFLFDQMEDAWTIYTLQCGWQ